MDTPLQEVVIFLDIYTVLYERILIRGKDVVAKVMIG
jgi:hypothetical protein